MDIERIREYCLSKKEVTESFPFDDTALVFKVFDKMFALLDLSEEKRGISLKCDPEKAVQLREQYKEVKPAYHFNKKYWNGINLEGAIHHSQIIEWIDHSYEEVVKKLSKIKQKQLAYSTK